VYGIRKTEKEAKAQKKKKKGFIAEIRNACTQTGLFNHRKRAPQYPLYRILCGPQNLSGHCKVGKSLVLVENRNPVSKTVSRKYTD
jgi:hypothetical protein